MIDTGEENYTAGSTARDQVSLQLIGPQNAPHQINLTFGVSSMDQRLRASTQKKATAIVSLFDKAAAAWLDDALKRPLFLVDGVQRQIGDDMYEATVISLADGDVVVVAITFGS